MNFLKNIFPGTGIDVENQIRHTSNKGDNSFEITSTKKPIEADISKSISVPVTVIEDEPTVVASEVEQPAIEILEVVSENANERNAEMIKESFLRVFSRENNKDVKIESQKNDGKIMKVGTLLRNAFWKGNALNLLMESFAREYGDNAGLNEDNIEEYIKRFCLDNIDSVKCDSVDTRTAIEAVCRKGQQLIVEDERNDDKLMLDTDAAWDKLFLLAEEMARKNNADRDSGQYIEEAKEFFNQEAAKLKALSAEINGRINEENGSITEYSEEVLTFFKSHIEKLIQMQQEYEINKEKFRKHDVAIEEDFVEKKIESEAPDFEDCKKLLVNIFDVAKREIVGTKIKGNLKNAESYLENFNQIRTEGLSKEELEKFKNLVAGASVEISKIITGKKASLERQEKRMKNKVTKKEVEIEKKAEEKKNPNREIADKFRNAAGLVEKSKLSKEAFEEKYGISLEGKIIEEADIEQSLLEYAEIIKKEHGDVVHENEHKFFWDNFDKYAKFVEKVNDPEYGNKLVVIEGVTYVVDKNIKKVEAGIANIEPNAVESEKEKNFEIVLKLAGELRSTLIGALENNEGWKKRRKEYQESFLEGEVVAFLDELLVQEDIVSSEEKEAFIKKVLGELKNV